MHQQIKASLHPAQGTPGAARRDGLLDDPQEIRVGALADLLEALAAEGVNIRVASGEGVETLGVFRFAVDDESRPEDLDKALAVLRRLRLPFEVRDVVHADLSDRPGALASLVRDQASKGLLVESVAVGTPDAPTQAVPNPPIPVQLTTLRVTGLTSR